MYTFSPKTHAEIHSGYSQSLNSKRICLSDSKCLLAIILLTCDTKSTFPGETPITLENLLIFSKLPEMVLRDFFPAKAVHF